jgi:hypothetical protein
VEPKSLPEVWIGDGLTSVPVFLISAIVTLYFSPEGRLIAELPTKHLADLSLSSSL